MCYYIANKKCSLVVCLLIALNLTVGTPPLIAAVEEIKPAPPKMEKPKEKSADDIFQEARTISDKYPGGAIQLLKECLALKPDLWQARKYLAEQYEKQNMWGLALSEYEAVNRASASPEGFSQIVRVLEKGGYFREAAATAGKAFEAFPDQTDFLLKVGELFIKSGNDKEAAAALRKYIKLKPEDGNAYLLMGGAQERGGILPEALSAYQRAVTLLPGNRDAADAVKRVASRGFTSENVWIFLPAGWIAEQNAMSNPTAHMRLTLTSTTGGTPETIALKSARAAIPGDIFSDEKLESYEKMKAMMEKADQEHPETAGMMQTLPVPLFSQKQIKGSDGACMVLLATSEPAQPGVVSVCAAAVPAGGRIYSIVLKADAPAAESEKALLSIISQILWPL